MTRKKYFLMLIVVAVFLSLDSPIRGESITNTSSDNIVINEVFYSTENISAWFELYNPTDRMINITGWQVWFYSINGPQYLPYINISPQEYVIICSSREDFTKLWAVPSGIRIFEIQFGFQYDSMHVTNGTLEIDGVAEEGMGEYSVKLQTITANHSWARYKGGYDTNNFTNDFYDEAIPTPGYENTKTIVTKTEEKEEKPSESLWLYIIILVVIIIALATAGLGIKRRKKAQPPERTT